MSFHRVALLSTAMLVPACLAEGELTPASFEELVDAEPRCLGCDWGPPLTNTHGLNGLSVAALDTTGDMHDGWRLVSVVISSDRGDEPIYDVRAEKGVLHGVDAVGWEYSGADFVDSVWTVHLEATDELVELEIVDFDETGAASRYSFMGGTPTAENGEGFTCAQDPETGEHSVVLFQDLDVDPDDGTHFARPSTIYFGCLSGAVGKAAVWGYSPWDTDDDMHQTATRAARADFCGDGTSYTVQGTPLQLGDVLHVHEFFDPDKATEAMWGPDGAQCLLSPRLGQDPRDIDCGGTTLPDCAIADDIQEWPSALLWTKNGG
jgi:hypothetical protein